MSGRTDWERLAAGDIGLHEIPSEAFEWYILGHTHASNSMSALVRQAQRDADRMAVFAMNPRARAEDINGRLDTALAACPPNLEPHSPEYFEFLLRRVATGGDR